MARFRKLECLGQTPPSWQCLQGKMAIIDLSTTGQNRDESLHFPSSVAWNRKNRILDSVGVEDVTYARVLEGLNYYDKAVARL